MGYKVFVSYKYSDNAVQNLVGRTFTTARDYVDDLQDALSEEDHLNKGEKDDESLADFKDSTIETKLKAKIFDSSITIVLISRNMWNTTLPEEDQWIPWEIAYSLRNKTRGGRTSYTNGMLAVVLPDYAGSYDYFIANHYCNYCTTTLYRTDLLFTVLRTNMFNRKNPEKNTCATGGHTLETGEFSYIKTIKWKDFIGNVSAYLELATQIRENRDSYNIAVNVY